MQKWRILMISFLFLASCGSPRSYLDKVIKEKGYIPFQLPMESTRVGTIMRGNDREMYMVARPERCFPDLPGDQALRWVQQTELPNEYKKVSMNFNAEANNALMGGNDLVRFKMSASHVRTVNIEFDGATIEYLDEWSFEDYWYGGMSDRCKSAIRGYQFIGQGLRVEEMRFQFLSASGANIDLSAGIDGIVDIEAGASWYIENRYTLVIDTPKYIGYRMAKVMMIDGIPHLIYASKTDQGGDWLFKSPMVYH